MTGVLGHVNRSRRARGLRPLRTSPALALSAHATARRLARGGQLEHTSRWWRVIERWARRRRERFGGLGENIARGQDTPAAVWAAWMDSRAHRDNILGDYTHHGVGKARRRGVTYWAQHFGKKR